MKVWIWVIVIVVVLVAAYFLLAGKTTPTEEVLEEQASESVGDIDVTANVEATVGGDETKEVSQ